jgi:hypothetical protein
MSVLRNPVQPLALTIHVGRIRLLSHYRFDFRQKSWGLPPSHSLPGHASILSADSADLASALSRNFSNFPTPSREAANPRRPHLAGFGKTKKQKNEVEI